MTLLAGAPSRDGPGPRSGPRGALLAVIGVTLFVWPERSASLWPWSLTPLTGRAVGAWLLGIGAGAGQAVWENEAARLRPGAVAYAVFGLLAIVAVARYPHDVEWAKRAAWIYLGLAASGIVVGVLGWTVGGTRPTNRSARKRVP